MGKKARGRKGGVEAADNAYNQRARASRAAAEAAIFSNTDRSAEPCPGFADFSASVKSLVEDAAAGRSMKRRLARLAQRGDVVLRLGAGEKNFAGADRMCTPCRRCSQTYAGGGIVCDVCGVTWWCSAHCRALDGDGHKATCHHVKLLGFQIKRDDMRALPYVQESGELGCVFDLPREKKCDVASAATCGDVAAIDRLLAQHGAAAAGATTDEDPIPPIVCAALQGHAKAVTRLLRAGADPNAASHLGCTAAFGAAQNGHVAVIEALAGSGADFDKPDAGAITPLGIAIENALPAVVDALLAAGADPDLRSGPNACPPLALAATQASEKTISTTLPDAMVRAGAPVLNFDASDIDTSGLDVSDSDEPRVRVAAAFSDSAKVSYMIDMPLVDYVSKQAEITARLLAAPGLRAVDGVPAFVPLVDFATAGAMNRVAAAPALAATRALIAAGADPNAARRADRSRDDDTHRRPPRRRRDGGGTRGGLRRVGPGRPPHKRRPRLPRAAQGARGRDRGPRGRRRPRRQRLHRASGGGAARLRQLRQDPALGQGRQAALQVRAVQVRRLLRGGLPEGALEGPQGRLPRGERLLGRSTI